MVDKLDEKYDLNEFPTIVLKISTLVSVSYTTLKDYVDKIDGLILQLC